MKRLFLTLLAVAAFTFGGTASAESACTPGPNWTRSWTDAFGQTTYEISAPPCVFVGVPFDIVLTVTDSFWNSGPATVGILWSVWDNSVPLNDALNTVVSPVDGASGSIIPLLDGFWQQTISVTYTTLIINHTIEFKFRDFGDKVDAAMNWTNATVTLSGLTVDPFPPADPPPVIDPPPVADPPPADSGIGCATSGGTAGLLALLAAPFALRRRRRA